MSLILECTDYSYEKQIKIQRFLAEMEIGSALIFYIISAIGFILGYDMLSASICGVVTLVMAFYSYRRSELIKFLEECGEIDPNL